MKYTFIIILFINSFTYLYSQNRFTASDINDGKEIIDYQHIHQGNFHWMKRVWREIYVDEKMNLVFQHNKQPLYNIIYQAISTGDIQVYSNDTIYPDELEKSITKNEALKIGCVLHEEYRINAETFKEEPISYNTCVEAKDIKKYRLMEDWYFDKNTSTMKVHIVSIAPVMEVNSTEGDYIGYSPMYWLNFDQLREILIHYPVFNSANDESLFTWDDLFLARTFSSVVIKESNVFDRNIASYSTGVDALIEGNRVQEELFFHEHDNWSY